MMDLLNITLVATLLDVAPVVLEHGAGALDHWGQGEFMSAFRTRAAATLGIAGFMMIVGVSTYIALYWWTKSYVVPTTVLVLTGGSILAYFPAVIARAAWIVILLAGALGLFAILWAAIR